MLMNSALVLPVSDAIFLAYCVMKNVFVFGSAQFQGEHGIKEEVYLSLPCVLTSIGVSHIVKQILTDSETDQLQKSAALMHQVQQGLKW